MHIVTYDRRGHGRSDRPPTGYDIDTLAHGSGRIARLVLSGTVTPMLLQSADNPDGISADVAVQSRAAMLRDIGDWMDMSGKAEYFSGEHRVSQQLLDWTLNTIAAVPLPILTQTSDAFLHADFRSELTELTIPTLVIHGTADTSMPIDLTARKTAPLIPDCRFITVDGAGHGLYLSESSRYNAALLEFIASAQAPVTASTLNSS
jgi:non-heme chloroperoxidase